MRLVGYSRLSEIENGKIVRPGRFGRNLILNEYATILAKMMAHNGPGWIRPNVLYLEFENVASPGDVVAVPSYTRADGAASGYYDALSGSKDFLRVPIVSTSVLSEDAGKYPGGNLVMYTGQSSGTEGVLGLEFGAGVNSKVYGTALGWAPDLDDRSQDLLYARRYFAGSLQKLKVPSAEVLVDWKIPYRTP